MIRRLPLPVVMLVGLLYLAIVVPMDVSLERRGTSEDGVVVRYESNWGRHRSYYPVVRFDRYGSVVVQRARNGSLIEWYGIGDHVPLLYAEGRPWVGSFLLRWSDVFMIAAAVAGLSVYLWWNRRNEKKLEA